MRPEHLPQTTHASAHVRGMQATGERHLVESVEAPPPASRAAAARRAGRRAAAQCARSSIKRQHDVGQRDVEQRHGSATRVARPTPRAGATSGRRFSTPKKARKRWDDVWGCQRSAKIGVAERNSRAPAVSKNGLKNKVSANSKHTAELVFALLIRNCFAF